MSQNITANIPDEVVDQAVGIYWNTVGDRHVAMRAAMAPVVAFCEVKLRPPAPVDPVWRVSLKQDPVVGQADSGGPDANTASIAAARAFSESIIFFGPEPFVWWDRR